MLQLMKNNKKIVTMGLFGLAGVILVPVARCIGVMLIINSLSINSRNWQIVCMLPDRRFQNGNWENWKMKSLKFCWKESALFCWFFISAH